jgi:ferredoxin
MEVGNNNQPAQPWPLESFSYLAADSNNTTVETGFTAADFLLNDQRLTHHFWNVPRNLWHEQMVPLHEYLQLDPDDITEQVPYILTANQVGEVGRVLVSRAVLASVMQCHGAWRYLQELGGINNSHAERLVAQQAARIAEEKQQEIAALEEQYRLQMEQDIGRLTEEIVRRIAQQLILEPGSAPIQPAPASRQPVTPPAAPATPAAEVTEAAAPEAAQEEEEDEDELEGMDDPYIVTQLCTSCNDCININKNLFGYDGDKRAFIKDASAGTYEELVRAAEKCPVHIIHPGKPKNPDEPGLEDLLKRAARYL